MEWLIIETMAILAAAMAGGKDRVDSWVKKASGIASNRCPTVLGASGGGADAYVPLDSKGEVVILIADGVEGVESGGVRAEPIVPDILSIRCNEVECVVSLSDRQG